MPSQIRYDKMKDDMIQYSLICYFKIRFKIRYDCTHPRANHAAQDTKFTHPTVKHRLPVPGISCCARRRASTTTFPSQRRTTGTRSWGRNLRWDWSVNNPPWLSKAPTLGSLRSRADDSTCFCPRLTFSDAFQLTSPVIPKSAKHLVVNAAQRQIL